MRWKIDPLENPSVNTSIPTVSAAPTKMTISAMTKINPRLRLAQPPDLLRPVFIRFSILNPTSHLTSSIPYPPGHAFHQKAEISI